MVIAPKSTCGYVFCKLRRLVTACYICYSSVSTVVKRERSLTLQSWKQVYIFWNHNDSTCFPEDFRHHWPCFKSFSVNRANRSVDCGKISRDGRGAVTSNAKWLYESTGVSSRHKLCSKIFQQNVPREGRRRVTSSPITKVKRIQPPNTDGKRASSQLIKPYQPYFVNLRCSIQNNSVGLSQLMAYQMMHSMMWPKRKICFLRWRWKERPLLAEMERKDKGLARENFITAFRFIEENLEHFI